MLFCAFTSKHAGRTTGILPPGKPHSPPRPRRGSLLEVKGHTAFHLGVFKQRRGNPSSHSRLFSLYSMKHSVQKPLFSGVPKYMQPTFLHLLVPILSPGVRVAGEW